MRKIPFFDSRFNIFGNPFHKDDTFAYKASLFLKGFSFIRKLICILNIILGRGVIYRVEFKGGIHFGADNDGVQVTDCDFVPSEEVKEKEEQGNMSFTLEA